jgi:hypothetical protein
MIVFLIKDPFILSPFFPDFQLIKNGLWVVLVDPLIPIAKWS